MFVCLPIHLLILLTVGAPTNTTDHGCKIQLLTLHLRFITFVDIITLAGVTVLLGLALPLGNAMAVITLAEQCALTYHKNIHEQLEEHNNEPKALTRPPNSTYLSIQKAYDHALTDQSCFSCTRGTCTSQF